MLSGPKAKPDARAKKYLAVVHYCTKTTHLQNTQQKLTCAFMYKRQFTPCFGITWFKFMPNWTKWRWQIIISRKWR